MSAEPLTRAHRDHIMSGIAWDIQSGLPLSPAHIDLPRYEATVQAAEERAERAEAKVARVQDVLDDAWIRLSPDAESALKEAIA